MQQPRFERMEKEIDTSLQRWAPPGYSQAYDNRHAPVAPEAGRQQRQQLPRGPGDDEEDGRYQRIFKLPNQSLHPNNSRSFPLQHLPTLPLLASPSPCTSASALPSPSSHGYNSAPNYYYPSGPATYDWTQALPPMRLKPPTPPTVPDLAPYHGGWEAPSAIGRVEQGEQAQFASSVHALTSLASHGGGAPEPAEWSPSNETSSGSGEGSIGHGGEGRSYGKAQERKTYASTDSEGEGDGIKSKKRKRRRKANEQPRDAAKRRFTCQADGCGKSFAR